MNLYNSRGLRFSDFVVAAARVAARRRHLERLLAGTATDADLAALRALADKWREEEESLRGLAEVFAEDVDPR